ncbi:MAG TPA: type II toxin-antitoxin system HicB family antitoxin [Candidatus Limnocylindrales bacterium]|nr:type II toxin-antitoxin system HicB family antitoxin [Candidatus Limnocylindrales bacterium]
MAARSPRSGRDTTLPRTCWHGGASVPRDLRAQDQGGYSVVIPAFPHGHTQGDTAGEALANAREVILLEIDYLRGRGLPIPESDSPEALIEFVSVHSPAA